MTRHEAKRLVLHILAEREVGASWDVFCVIGDDVVSREFVDKSTAIEFAKYVSGTVVRSNTKLLDNPWRIQREQI